MVGIHQYSSIAEDLRQRRRIGSKNWSAIRHSFERRKTEAFVKGWKREQRGRLIEDAQNRIRNKAKETYVLLRAAADNGQSQVLMLAQLVADDDQFQVLVLVVLSPLALQHRESFDQSMKILVRPDLSRVEHKRIFELISFQYLLAFLRNMRERETFIQRVVDN